jgi:predicted acetyltransferase
VIARRGDADVGYVVYRQRATLLGGVATGRAEIVELIGVDPHAEASLWRYMVSLDLFPRVTWWNAPVDDALAWRVEDARRIVRTPSDTLWLRVEDVSAALGARSYAIDGGLRLAVDGATWELVARDGRGHAEPTAQPAELQMSRATLGALYLGGTSASRLARAGLVTGAAAAIARADALFGWTTAPWCPEVF